MRRSRFSLTPKSTVAHTPAPASPRRKSLNKKDKSLSISKTSILDPIPMPVLERSIDLKDEQLGKIEEEEEEEEMQEYEDELDELAGLTRKELLEIYRVEYNNYLNNIDRISEIIEEKLTKV